MKDNRYQFLQTGQHDGQVVAYIADVEKLGTGGVDSLKNALRADKARGEFNKKSGVLIREGVLTLNAEELRLRLEQFKQQGGDLPVTIQEYSRALDCVQAREAGVAPPPIKRAAAMGMKQ